MHGEQKKGGNATARVVGSAIAGISELLIFHPIVRNSPPAIAPPRLSPSPSLQPRQTPFFLFKFSS